MASWRGGEASNYVGPNIGFIARIAPSGLQPQPFADLTTFDLDRLIQRLQGPNSVARFQAQREIIRRGRADATTAALKGLASADRAPLEARVAAIFALKQLDGKDSNSTLLKLIDDAAVREFALRALTDRKGELDGLPIQAFVNALTDASQRVRAQALISLSRLNAHSAAKAILPLTSRLPGSAMSAKAPPHAQPDADRVIPHLAVNALVSMRAVDACLEALDGPHAAGAFWSLRLMHDKRAVDGLIAKLATARLNEQRRAILSTLIRLHHREAEYTRNWWGIRPENAGPYYDAIEWDQTARIGAVVKTALLDTDPESAAFLRVELERHGVELSGLPNRGAAAVSVEKESPVVVVQADPNNPNQIGNLDQDAAVKRVLAAKGNAVRGKALFKTQSCIACHTDADGQTLKGPHLVDIGKRYSAPELIESILKPSAKIAQGFETIRFDMADGKSYAGFVVSERARSVIIRETTAVQHELKLADIESRTIQKVSMMPEGLANNLTPEQLADLIAYLQSLSSGAK